MRASAVLCAIVLNAVAACSSDGVSIEIRRGSTTAERVELYIMDGICTTDPNGELPCPQLKTPSAPFYLDGQVYTRDDARTLSAKMKSGVAYFTVEANGDETRIPLLVAVGFDASDHRVGAVMIAREFYTTDNNRQIATLEEIVEDRVTGAAEAACTGAPAKCGLRVETWYHDPVGCLALEHTTQGQPVERTFIVPADDLDCDGFVDPMECDSIWPNHGPNDDSNLTYTCVVEDESGMNGNGKRCMLGDAPCIDGMGPATCKPVVAENQTWCVPSTLCDALCRNDSNPTCLYTALKRPTQPMDKHPTFVHCKVPVQVSTGQDALSVCRTSLAADVGIPLPVPSPTTCRGLAIAQIGPMGFGMFSPTYTSSSTPIGRMDTTVSPQCVSTFTISGEFENATLDNVAPDLVVKLDLSNGMSLVLPLLIDLDPVATVDECTGAQLQCFIEFADQDDQMDESLAACARH